LINGRHTEFELNISPKLTVLYTHVTTTALTNAVSHECLQNTQVKKA